jgi:hypothetical protein
MVKKILIFLSVVSIVGISAYYLYVQKSRSEHKLQVATNSSLTKLANKLPPVEQIQIKQNRLERLSQSQGLPEDPDKTDKYIEEQAPVIKNSDQISNYQAYVTPDDSAVSTRASGKSAEQLYQDSLSWIWVEDQVLNGEADKWLLPNVFLTQTPTMPTNPASGKIASDCEEHAYTLVSLLRAAGISSDNVRVVTGKINFSDNTGGHVWVEMYDAEKKGWFQLEPSSGDNYDSETKQLVQSDGLPFDYFKTHQYPVTEIWTYFNDKYFWDNNRQQGVRPSTWENGVVEEFMDQFPIRYPDIPTPTNTITPSPIPTYVPPPTATPSASIIPQPTLSPLQSIQLKFIQIFMLLQQSDKQQSITDLADQTITEISQSAFPETQKQTLTDLINKIKNIYGTTITLSDLIKLRQEIISAFGEQQATPQIQRNPRQRNRFFSPTNTITPTPTITP